jgi:hypothetical protein
MKDCTATQYIDAGWLVASVAQMQITMRCHDYSRSCMMWASLMAIKPYAQNMDQLRVNDLAKMAATLAFLAFPDLRPERVTAEVAA